ncbi:MAG: ABC transporter permease [Spirochaetaceae bacterium]|jgi:AI-2 transport system permease protein|nr:ABC transporter permease [Spirochaetaceae bacterium]
MPGSRKSPFNPQKLLRWESFLVILILLEAAVFGAINPRFLRPSVLFGSFNDFTSICVISIFVTFVLITGGMDIQSGSIVGLSSIVLGLIWASFGLNIWLAAVLTIVTGAACGAFSGFLVAFTGVPAMVVTLGCSFLYSGFAKTIMKLARIETHKGISGFPASFTAFTGWTICGVPFQFVIFLFLALTAHLLLHRTKYGRYVFLCGINRNAAEYSGINSRFVIMSAYIMSGLGASLAGIILTSYLGTAKPDFGKELTLPIITAVVLGGTSILGGRGTILGTALAAIVIGLMRFGLSMSGVSTQYLDIPVGFLLIISVGLRALAGNRIVIKKFFDGVFPAVGRSK